MSAFEEQPCVGLFGTCGPSTFRQDLFIPALEQERIPYFNPQLPEGTWTSASVPVEADHLAFDTVQLWPVTGETYGAGSLSEQGHSIASSIRAESPFPKFVVPMIEMDINPDLDDEVTRNESMRARKLSAGHIALSASPNVFPVKSLDEMIDKGIKLHRAAEILVDVARGHNPAYQRFVAGRAEADRYRLALESGQLGSDIANIANR